jgi:hypothetical protein
MTNIRIEHEPYRSIVQLFLVPKILPNFESFQISPKNLIFEISYFIICPKNSFFKKVNVQSFREFYGLLKSIKINFKPFWSYIDFGKVLKKTENSKYLSKY